VWGGSAPATPVSTGCGAFAGADEFVGDGLTLFDPGVERVK
jgi:hypothetical protein